MTGLGKDFRRVTSYLFFFFYVHLCLYKQGNLKQLRTSHDGLATLSQIHSLQSLDAQKLHWWVLYKDLQLKELLL